MPKKKIRKKTTQKKKPVTKKRVVKTTPPRREASSPRLAKASRPASTRGEREAGYTAKDIYVLKGLDPVRRRPGMYIGSTGSDGLHHLIWEVIDNSLDEALQGYCTEIGITLLPNNRVAIADNGRGIPVEKQEQTKLQYNP